MPKSPTVVYIISDNRSGSTLLDQLLGAHPQMRSVGEMHHLAAYALRDRTLYDPKQPLECACGAILAECPFWRAVETELRQPLHSLTLRLRFFGARDSSDSRANLQRFPRRLLERYPTLFCIGGAAYVFGANRVAADSLALVDAIGRVTAANYVIDSSKSAFRFRALYDRAPDRTRGIILVRDYRAIAFSKMKRGRNLISSVRGWVSRMREMAALTCDIPAEHLIYLRYEDLCANPRSTMMEICKFLKIEFQEKMLSRPESNNHNLGGSPSKFDPKKREIRLDTSYRNAFTHEQEAAMRAIAAEFASQWGYD